MVGSVPAGNGLLTHTARETQLRPAGSSRLALHHGSLGLPTATCAGSESQQHWEPHGQTAHRKKSPALLQVTSLAIRKVAQHKVSGVGP